MIDNPYTTKAMILEAIRDATKWPIEYCDMCKTAVSNSKGLVRHGSRLVGAVRWQCSECIHLNELEW